MMDIKLLKKLREQTGAGMLECRRALEKYDNDYDQALNHINSLVKEEIRSNRVASKGMCRLEIKSDEAVLFEVNAETDFVTKNKHYTSLVDELATLFIHSDAVNVRAALKLDIKDQSVEDYINLKSKIISENVYLRRLYRVKKQPSQGFGSYTHMQGKVISLVITDTINDVVANEIAMQITAANAEYISLDLIDQDTINYEKFMFKKEHKTSDEDAFMDHLKSKTLLSQNWIKDSSISVRAYLEKHQIQIVDFYRFELGQGIDNKLNCRLDIPHDNSKITVTPIY